MITPGFAAPSLDASRLVSLSFGRVFLHDHHGAPRVAEHPQRGQGAALPLLLLHGLLVTSHAFARLIPELVPPGRVLAPDHPGCGDSDRPPPAGTALRP